MSEMRTYEVKTGEGTYRFDIPEGWKVTFGEIHPGIRSGQAYVMRVWESKDKQRMVVRDVISFRDTSISITKLEANDYDSALNEWVEVESIEEMGKEKIPL